MRAIRAKPAPDRGHNSGTLFLAQLENGKQSQQGRAGKTFARRLLGLKFPESLRLIALFEGHRLQPLPNVASHAAEVATFHVTRNVDPAAGPLPADGIGGGNYGDIGQLA